MFRGKNYKKVKKGKKIIIKTPMFDFVKAHFRLKGEPFDFHRKEYLVPIQNALDYETVIMSGRQVEKSTTCSIKLLGHLVAIPKLRATYIAPVLKQVSTFSKDRMGPLIESSPYIYKTYGARSRGAKLSITDMHLANGSYLALRSCYNDSVDSIRGLSNDLVTFDEVQDLLYDNLPVIIETLSHSFLVDEETGKRGRILNTGTPKTLDNTLTFLYETSTQNWLSFPCPFCGEWHLGCKEENIKENGFYCTKCGKVIDVAPIDKIWVQKYKRDREHPRTGFQLSQPFMPWIQWSDIYDKYAGGGRYPIHRFYNEVLGLPYDNASKVFTITEFKESIIRQLPGVKSWDDLQKKFDRGQSKLYAGMDWGSGDKSKSALTLSVWDNDSLVPIFMKKFEGAEADRDYEYRYVRDMMRRNPDMVLGSDYGDAYHENTLLLKEFGAERVMIFYHSAAAAAFLKYDPHKRIYITSRTDVMQKQITDMKLGIIKWFGTWEMYQDFVPDFVAITMEYNERLHKYQFIHKPTHPDDQFHSALYSYLARLIHSGEVKPLLTEDDPETYARTLKNY